MQINRTKVVCDWLDNKSDARSYSSCAICNALLMLSQAIRNTYAVF
jgi:hypothetical protein